MDIQRKLEEIRRKPAHIRLRYTYFAVAISMFFIILLWFFSLANTLEKSDLIKKQNVFEDVDTQKKSLKDATSEIKDSFDALNSNFEKTAPEALNNTKPDTEEPFNRDIPTSNLPLLDEKLPTNSTKQP